MISTAVKEKDYHESDFLTPVRYLESPKVQSITSDSNLNACRARLDSIMKTIQDDFSKWLLAERRGLALCNAIETIKTRTLVAVTASENDKVDSTLYPNDLASHCHKLSLIVCIFQDIVANAKNFLKQIKSLSKLQGSSQKILFRSWSLNQFIDFLTELTQRYEEEYQIKKHTMENLPHCLCRADLIRCTSDWEYPQFIDSYVLMMFLFLNEELNVKKK